MGIPLSEFTKKATLVKSSNRYEVYDLSLEKLAFSVNDSFEEEVKAFLDCIDSDSPVTTGNGQDALKVMRLVERIYAEK